MTLIRPSLPNVRGSTMSAVPSQLLATNSTDFVPGATGGPSWAEAVAGSAVNAARTAAAAALIRRSRTAADRNPERRRDAPVGGLPREPQLGAALCLQRARRVARLG